MKINVNRKITLGMNGLRRQTYKIMLCNIYEHVKDTPLYELKISTFPLHIYVY